MRKFRRALAVLALSMVALGAFAAGPSKILPTQIGRAHV